MRPDPAVTAAARPLASFVVAVYNGAAGLQRCLDSIRAQTLASWEIVVVDGGSTDGTVDILKANAADLAFWVSEPDRGIYDAWNKALAHVRGEWIHFLGADDWLWDADVLKAAAPRLAAAAPRHRVVYGRVAVVNATGRTVEMAGEPWERIRRRFRRAMCIPHQGVFHHRSLVDEGRRFDAGLRYAADYEFLLAEVKDRPPLFLPELTVAAWTLGGVSSTPARALAVLREMQAARRRHGIGGPGPLWTMAKAWVKARLPALLGADATARVVDAYRRVTGRPSQL